MSDSIQVSKFLSLVLRHKPEAIGLTLDQNGWAKVEDLLRLANSTGRRLTRPLLEHVVAENDKQRFAFSDDGQYIRANQGHSIAVDLALAPSAPPTVLYHGTAARFVASMRATDAMCISRVTWRPRRRSGSAMGSLSSWWSALRRCRRRGTHFSWQPMGCG